MFKKLKKSVAVLVAAAMVAGTAGTLSTTIFADETSGTDSTELTTESSSDVSEEIISTDDNDFTAQETSESAVTAQDTVETNEATSAFDKCESINIDDTNLYIHLTAPEGVLPTSSYFTVNKTECDSDTETLLGAARGEDTFVFESHILDITLYNSDGVQIEPDTSAGQVSIVLGVSSMTDNPASAADAVKNEVVSGALEKLTQIYQNADVDLSSDDIQGVIEEVVFQSEDFDISYSADEVDLAIYHIAADASHADALSTERIYNDSAISADRLVQAYTDSFSKYAVEFSVSCDIEGLTDQVVTAASEVIDEALSPTATFGLHFTKTWLLTSTDSDGNTETTELNSWSTFEQLRQMNVLPETAEYIVQRSVDGENWEYIESTQNTVDIGSDGDHQYVVGYTVNIADLTSSTFADINPDHIFGSLQVTCQSGEAYTYRVIERLKWAGDDNYYYYYGTEDDPRQNGITCRAEIGDDASINMINKIDESQCRLEVLWDDDSNFDNTRPDSVTVSISPKSGDSTSSLTYVLTATDDTPNLYRSEEFIIAGIQNPDEWAADGESNITEDRNETHTSTSVVFDTLKNFTITETYTYSDGRSDLYEYHTTDDLTVAPDDNGVYVFQITNHYKASDNNNERKKIQISATKQWSESCSGETYSTWLAETTRPALLFELQYKDPTANS